MKDIPLRSYVELCDASDNLDSILSRLDDELSKSLILDISKDVESAITKLQNIVL